MPPPRHALNTLTHHTLHLHPVPRFTHRHTHNLTHTTDAQKHARARTHLPLPEVAGLELPVLVLVQAGNVNTPGHEHRPLAVRDVFQRPLHTQEKGKVGSAHEKDTAKLTQRRGDTYTRAEIS